MRVLLAQEFEVVRREIDDQQAAARAQYVRGFADRTRAVVEKVQHLMDNDGVERIAQQRQVVDVAVAHAAILRPERSSRARASASMSRDRSSPMPRSICGANSSSIRPVPVPRSSSERIGLSASAA